MTSGHRHLRNPDGWVRAISALLVLLVSAVPTWSAEEAATSPEQIRLLLMADYQGANRESTVIARTESIARFVAATHVRLKISTWPDKIHVGDPTGDNDWLDDGDRGFIWQMSRAQVEALIIARMKKKKESLTVIVDREVAPERAAITAWASQHGFPQVDYE